MLKRIDLTRDYQKHKAEYLEAIQKVCEDTAFSGGKYADEFDKEFAQYCGVPYASGVNNGTSALHCAMVALGIGEGDEVIVPANTYIATAWGVTYTGATPVFVDCTADTWEIDPDKIEEKITEKTKAIIGVHLYGQPFEFNKVKEIADRHHLYVVEDCAQGHDALYEGKMVGTLGDLGCFSFYPGKNLYAFGEGGSVTGYRKEYFDTIEMMKNQGCTVRYYHDMIGYNYRLEGIQGAVLSVSLKYLPAGGRLDGGTQRKLQIRRLPCSIIRKIRIRSSICLRWRWKMTRNVFWLIWQRRELSVTGITRCPAICRMLISILVTRLEIVRTRSIWHPIARRCRCSRK